MSDDVTVHHGKCEDVLPGLPDASFDACVTDPPYEFSFMGKSWDGTGVAFKPETWAQVLHLLKPGGHLLAFGGSRTFHRLACAIEDAGFEIRDTISWLYGSGFPKSLDVSKAIDKAARGVPQGGSDPTSPNHGNYRTTTTEGKRWDGDSGQGYGAGGSRFLADGKASGGAIAHAASGSAETAPEAALWKGWGTALKPAWEPIIVARKPLAGTVAANVLAHGTGALNIDGCRIEHDGRGVWGNHGQNPDNHKTEPGSNGTTLGTGWNSPGSTRHPEGRWPANVVLDEDAAAELDRQSGERPSGSRAEGVRKGLGYHGANGDGGPAIEGSLGGASRFFYTAKAAPDERPRVNGVAHPTVKPLDLMRWLVRLVTPPGGLVLDPFAGSGTTGEACLIEGFRCVLIEREADYLPLIRARLSKPIQPVLEMST